MFGVIIISRLLVECKTITERDIPVITCYPENMKNLPLVLLNHGTTGSSYDMLPMAVRLADEGFFCLCIDALWHGRRSDGKLEERLESRVYKKNYLHLLLSMAEDMSALIDFFEKDDRADTSRAGMTGISQGGYVAFMTMTKDARIKAAAPLIGSPDLEDKYGNSPDWEEIEQETREQVMLHNPLRNCEKMFPTALLVQSSIEDKIVPVTGARRLDERLKPLYSGNMEDYKYIEYPDIGHDTPWVMFENAISWLKEKL